MHDFGFAIAILDTIPKEQATISKKWSKTKIKSAIFHKIINNNKMPRNLTIEEQDIHTENYKTLL